MDFQIIGLTFNDPVVCVSVASVFSNGSILSGIYVHRISTYKTSPRPTNICYRHFLPFLHLYSHLPRYAIVSGQLFDVLSSLGSQSYWQQTELTRWGG